MTSIVVLGGSFAGINAAFELELGQSEEITVVSRDPAIPSLSAPRRRLATRPDGHSRGEKDVEIRLA